MHCESCTRFAAILFDFDGTLADSYPGITASVNHVRAVHGLEPLPEDEVRRHIGRGPDYLMANTVPRGDVARNVALYKEHHPAVMQAGTRLFPGVGGVLQRLDEIGLVLGVCSNKPRAFTLALLDHLGISGRFRLVVGPEDVVRPKPAPDMLILAMKRLGVDASKVLFVGDMVVDIETARAAGVSVWVVPTGSDDRGTLENWVPDRLLTSLEEIPMLLAMSPEQCPSAPAKNKLGQK